MAQRADLARGAVRSRYSQPMPIAITVSGLTKTFGHVQALDELDLEVATAEVHRFLGPNGAGKSTTIRGHGPNRRHESRQGVSIGAPWAD